MKRIILGILLFTCMTCFANFDGDQITEFSTPTNRIGTTDEIDFGTREVISEAFTVTPIGAAPLVPVEGNLYADSVANALYFYNGAVWLDLTAGAAGVTYIQVTEVWTADGGGAYTLAHSPSGSVEIVANRSALQYEGAAEDYTKAGAVITFNAPLPPVGMSLAFTYIYKP